MRPELRHEVERYPTSPKNVMEATSIASQVEETLPREQKPDQKPAKHKGPDDKDPDLKSEDKNPSSGKPSGSNSNYKKKKGSGPKDKEKGNPKKSSGRRKPPSPCMHCEGDHWNNNCPKKPKSQGSTGSKPKENTSLA